MKTWFPLSMKRQILGGSLAEESDMSGPEKLESAGISWGHARSLFGERKEGKDRVIKIRIFSLFPAFHFIYFVFESFSVETYVFDRLRN